nr:integrase, catalytic region, zinc finger, CCHC-type, peptidase aspartic, catalytic [Tanacetum cinerariifolium]
MCNNEFKDDQNTDDNDEDERVELANLIANLKLDIDENKKIQKKLRKANATLNHELNESKYALTESNDIRDRCKMPFIKKRDIAISELKKLIEKSKGKSVETKFDKPPVVRQTNAIKVPKPSVLGKPAPFSDSLEKRDFSKQRSITKTDANKWTVIAFCLWKTLSISKLGCVLSQDLAAFCLEDFLRFVSRPAAFCLKTWLHFVSRLTAFCLKTLLRFVSRLGCVLSQDLMRFVSRLTAFCLKIVAFCLQASCVLFTFEDLFCVLIEGNSGKNFLHYGRFVTAVKRNKGLKDSNYDQLGQGMNPRGGGAAGYGGSSEQSWECQSGSSTTEGSELIKEDWEWQLYDDFEHFRQHKRESIHDYYVRFDKLINDMRNIKMTMYRMQMNSKFVNNMLPEWGRFVTAVKLNRGLRDSNYDQLYAYLKQHKTHAKENKMMLKRFSQYTVDPLALMSNAQENGVALDAKQLLFLAGGHDNAFDDDVYKQPVQDLAFNIDNVFQADDCDAFDSDVDEAPTAQTMFMANLSSADPVTDEARPSYDLAFYLSVQLNHVVDSHADYTSNSNMILYDQYVKDNEVPVVYSNVSFVPNDAFMMIYNDICEPHAQHISNPSRNTVVENSLTAELATYKEQVELYERRAKFELTKREQKINEQLRLVISDLKEETLKEELHLIKLQLASTITHNKSMRITPTGLIEGERGFEQTKECYLKEVIPFFKTLKDNFEGIQKALTNEIKEMKDVFEELEAEVAQNVVDRKHDAIERKNLLIANDNLIAECLSKEVFSVATNSELNVARFIEMHVANTIVEARCLTLEAELDNLRDKSHHDNQEELINRFSKLEVNHLNLQLKYQNLKDSFGNNPPTPDKDTPDFNSVFVTGKMQASFQGKDNVIRQLKKKISQLQVTRSNTDRTLKHYKELYDSIKITHAKHIKQVTALTTKNVNLKAHILEKVNNVSKDQVKPKVFARGKYAIDVEPIVPRLRNNRDAHLSYPRHLKESVETICDIVEEAKVVRPLDRFIVSVCRYTKHSQELLEYAIRTCPQGSQCNTPILVNIAAEANLGYYVIAQKSQS